MRTVSWNIESPLITPGRHHHDQYARVASTIPYVVQNYQQNTVTLDPSAQRLIELKL